MLERHLANATHTPLGYLFLPEPPDEKLPIPDLPDAKTAMLYDLEERAEEAVERLLEYRRAYITATAAGKFRV